MPRSSRQKSRRSHKHGEARDRSASEDDGALKDRKPKVEESRVSEPEKRKSSSSLQPSKDKDPVVTSNGDLSGEHGRKRKDRAEDSAVAVVDDRWSGGAEDEHVGDKKPKAEGFEAVELKKAGRSKASGGESKSRSNQRQDGSGERIEEVGGKPKSEKDLSRRDSTGSQHKNVKEKDHNKDTKERDKDIKDSKERDREYIKDKDKDKEYKDAKERDREYKDAKERSRDHPKDTKDRDRDHPKDAKERDATEKDATERDSKERDSKERVAKERDSKERVAKERDTKERDSKERDAKDRDVKERDTKDRDAKERDTKDRDAKERDVKERDTKDRGDAKERDVKERDTKERDAKERDKDHHRDVKDRDRDYYKEDRDRDYYKDAKDRDRENYKDSKEREKDYSKDARERDRDHTKDTKERDKDHSKDTRERDRDYYKDARERDRDYSKDARERDRDRGTERDKRVQDTRHERTDDVVSRKQASKIKTSGEEHGSKKNIENSGGKAQEGVRNLEPEKELDKNIRRRDGSGDKSKYPGDGDDRRLSSRDDHTRNSNHKDEKEGRYRDRYKEELDRDQRDRDDRGRDERTSRDHNSSKSGNKHFRDENRLPEGHYKKSKIQDTDHDTCPYIDDHGTKLKDNRGIDLKPRGSKEVHEDVEKNASSTSKLDPHSDRVRLDYMHADKVDSSMGSSRRKSSPSSGNHTMRDQFRASSKQGGSSSRKASSEDKQRLNTATRGDNVSVPGVHERDSESRTLERRKPKEGVRLGEVEPTAPHYDKSRSDARHSSNSLVQKSPSTGSDRRFPDKIGARRSFDPNSSKHGRDFPNSKDRDRGFEKSMSNDFYRGEMFDSEPIPTSFNRTNHLSGSSPSHLPPPPSSGHGTGSPSVLGSYEDDNRNQLGDRKPNNRFRRSGEHGIGRGQGNSWKSPATWQSPVPNGFISLQHGPPHPGYHPGVQQFPSPLYGVRPSLELNHTGVYHMHEAADRFSNHVRPFGWHNPMDDCPPLPVWDARNGGVFGDESHAYGRPEWEVNRQLMGNRGWEMTADMWKGQNGNMNMELPMPQDSEYSACSEAWTGQTGLQSRREKDPSDCLPTVSSEVKLSNDRSPAKDGIENFQKSLNEKTSELSKPTVSDATTTGNEDIKIQLCCSYLSKIDISLDLTQPGLYQECKFLLGSRNKAGVYNNMIKKDNGQSTQGDPTVAVPSRNNILSSVFPLSEDTVFQRAMSLYKKHGNRRKVTSSPSSCPEDKGSLEVLESQKPAGEDIETISADSLMAELVMVADNQTSDDTPANVDSTSNFVEECTDNQTSDDMPANVDSTSNFVEECMPICPEGSDSDEAMDQQSDTPDAVNSVEGSQSCETIMAECRVNVSRIHLSPGSTH